MSQNKKTIFALDGSTKFTYASTVAASSGFSSFTSSRIDNDLFDSFEDELDEFRSDPVWKIAEELLDLQKVADFSNEQVWIKFVKKIIDMKIQPNSQVKLRIELFNSIPSRTNMILAFELMEKIVLELYKKSSIDIDEKLVGKFDKIKNLALSTNHIEERKTSFNVLVSVYERIIKTKVKDA